MRSTRIVWRGVCAIDSTEACVVTYADGGIRISGDVEAASGGCRYDLSLDEDGTVRSAAVQTAGRVVRIERTGSSWTVDGRERRDLAGATDLDITATPATNALPIRRLGLAVGEHADLDVAWVQLPELRVDLARQRYTRTGPRAYRYESLDDGFRRAITVDDDGFVVSYPGLFERAAAS